MSDQEFDFGAFAAEQTGTSGISDDAGYDQAVPDALANDVDDYDRQAEIRDAHLADDADPDDAEQVDPTSLKNKSVPLGALQEERMRRKEAQEAAAQLQQQFAALQQQQAQQQAAIQQYLQQQAQAQLEAEIPDFESDPQGHVEAVKAQMQRELQGMQQQLQAQQQTAQFAQQLQSDMAVIAPTVTASEDAMREEVGAEAYDAAYQHVHQYAQAEIARMYPGATPALLAQLEGVASIAFVQQCQAQGIDPARHIFEKAQRLGFTQPGRRVPAQERRAAPTSLSTIPAAGRAPDQRGRLTAKDIATMPQDEFDQMFESMRAGAAQWPI
ncbi:hypothetical protein [Pseudomonas putida]|uniref:hypothetical protein n=1 Tax=Pseudomonas putida TaxID=303 RepID=UPI0015F80830|nr:hypothetical protein [Pseudomonas putida]